MALKFIKNLRFTFFICCIPTILISQSAPGSWTQFRGPDRNGIATNFEMDDAISNDGPELVWKRKLGAGFSEITVESGTLYTLFSESIDSTSGFEFLGAFARDDGNLLWRTKIDTMFFDTFGDGPRSTPAIGKELIFCLSSYGKLSAVSKSAGKLVWQVDLPSTFGSVLPRWAFSTSPILVDDILIIEVGGKDSSAFIGFDQNSGEVLWKKGEGEASYCSPAIGKIGDETNIIFANQTMLFSFNAKGDTLWTHKMSMNGPMAMPVFFDNNKIFISTIRSKGFCIVEINDHKATEIVNAQTMKNDFSSSIYFDGHFYGFNVAALQCVSAADGNKKWTKRGYGKGSLILVNDILMVLSDKGKLIQVKASPDQYSELGFFQALDGKSWTAPSFANGYLYVRNLTEMACYKMN